MLVLEGRKPHILIAYADAMAMSMGGAFQGEPNDILLEALSLDSMQPQGLWLAGVAAHQTENYQKALFYWNQLKLLFDEDESGNNSDDGMCSIFNKWKYITFMGGNRIRRGECK